MGFLRIKCKNEIFRNCKIDKYRIMLLIRKTIFERMKSGWWNLRLKIKLGSQDFEELNFNDWVFNELNKWI